MAEGGGYSKAKWDPTNEPASEPTSKAKKEIMAEWNRLKDGHEYSFIKIYFDDEDLTKVDVLFLGNLYTPYARGFFYFRVRFPPNYPNSPPKVKLMNTGKDGVYPVRFNPNIYDDGMVCHSLLGTWEGASWDPEYDNLSDVLETIAKMLNKKPYSNEPVVGIPFMPFPEYKEGDAERYNDVIRHETMRVAVCEMMEGKVEMPELMRKFITEQFINNYSNYVKTCKKNGCLDGQELRSLDPFDNTFRPHKFNYTKILRRLKHIKADLDKREKDSKSSKKVAR